MSDVVCINFAKPMPLFPLSETVLLPHAVQPLHIFELRYRQMIAESLDTSGQIAMAVLGDEAMEKTIGDPGLLPAVCIGQIVQHEPLDDGRYNVLVHGVCRARIREVFEPQGERLYRSAILAPVEQLEDTPTPMADVRDRLYNLLQRDRLQRLRCIDGLIEWFDREELPTQALVELIGFALVRDAGTRYALLAEPDARRRAQLVCREICSIDSLIARAEQQSHPRWPKGVSWN